MSLLHKFSKGLQAFSNEVTKPSSFVKGEAFEKYVREYMFPIEDYICT